MITKLYVYTVSFRCVDEITTMEFNILHGSEDTGLARDEVAAKAASVFTEMFPTRVIISLFDAERRIYPEGKAKVECFVQSEPRQTSIVFE